jgi:ribosomal protein S18 acetylase RimI-like enzyme
MNMPERAVCSLGNAGAHGLQMVAGGSEEGERSIEQLAQLYESDLQSGAFSKERFREKFLQQYITKPNFKLVLLRDGATLVGFVCGNSLVQGTRWCSAVEEPLPEGFTEEDGTRTVALKDIVVAKEFRGQGLGRELHDCFLRDRKEERVTLLSSELDQPAHSIWQHWGYRKIGTVKPAGIAEVMNVFVRPLTSNSRVSMDV